MKNILIRTIFLWFSVTAFANKTIAQDTKQNSKNERAATISKLVNSPDFTFIAQYAMPFRGSSRYLNSLYDLKVFKDTVISYLPYFGRAFTITDPTNIGYEFTSTNYKYTVTPAKRGGWDVVLKPIDQMNIQQLNFRIFENGSATLRITSVDREAITYQGYIKERKNK